MNGSPREWWNYRGVPALKKSGVMAGELWNHRGIVALQGNGDTRREGWQGREQLALFGSESFQTIGLEGTLEETLLPWGKPGSCALWLPVFPPGTALKYSTAFPVIILSAIKYHVSVELWKGFYRPLWLAASLLNTCYSYYWDIARDWDLRCVGRTWPRA